MSNNVDVKDFTLGTARTMKTRETSTVNTPLHQLEDSAGGEIVGTKTDAKSTATDTTSVSLMSVFKQISASAQALVTAFGSAWTRGAGATDSNTQRIAIASDSAGIIATGTAGSAASAVLTVQGIASMTALKVDNSAVTQPVSHSYLTNLGVGEYETVAASQTDQALGATGATGDFLQAVVIVPGTAAAGAVSIKDGSGSAISLFAGGGTTALPTLAPIRVDLGVISTGGAWKVTTGSNVTAIGIGNFT